MNKKILLFFIVIFSFSVLQLYAESFKIKVDLDLKGEVEEVALKLPKGSEKAAERYFRLAKVTHPHYLDHAYAALATKQVKAEVDDDPLGDLDETGVEGDAIQVVDKDVEYAIRTDKSRKSYVLIIVNRKNESFTGNIELVRGKMYEPVYRRVYSEDGGKSWTTAAWQPPRASDVYPWTVEVPANTVQTITIILR
jgi:hypothetical protein